MVMTGDGVICGPNDWSAGRWNSEGSSEVLTTLSRDWQEAEVSWLGITSAFRLQVLWSTTHNAQDLAKTSTSLS